MSNLSEIRQQKHNALNGGTYPIQSGIHIPIETILEECNTYAKTSFIPDELDSYCSTTHGRIKAIRKSGNLIFFKIQDNTGAIQLIASKKVIECYNSIQWNDLSNFDIGDIVEVTGQLCFTIKGEKSILIHNLKLLSKAILPLPEKWAGLRDKEAIFHQRYLDLLSNEESMQRFKDRSAIIKSIRSFMDKEDFMEVETSILQSLNSGANAKPFITHHNAADKNLYLRIAPELNLKRLIVGGMDKIYEIGKSFRNEGVSYRHNPEFTMLEMYSAYDTILHMMNRIQALIASARTATAGICNKDICFDTFEKVTMLQAVQNSWFNIFGFKIPDTLEARISDDFDPSQKFLPIKRINELASNNCNLSWGQRLAELFELIAEPFLKDDYRTTDGTQSVPVFITDFPAEICPLARKSDNNPLFCDRFELYIDGMEVANGYQELNDPVEQKKRFKEQLKSNQKDPMDLDEDYIVALSYGMPPTVGAGIGICRLVQILTNASSIKDVILFPSV